MGILDYIKGWERCKTPKWVIPYLHRRYKVSGGDVMFDNIKGKTFRYKVKVIRWKGGNEKDKCWRKLRRKAR